VQNCRHEGVVNGAVGEDDGQEGHRVGAHLCRGVWTYQPSKSGSFPQGSGDHAPGALFLLRAGENVLSVTPLF
jgi:hypothetical protein